MGLRASVDITVKKKSLPFAGIEVRYPGLPDRSLATIPTELQRLRSAQADEQTGNQAKNETKNLCITKFILACYNSIGLLRHNISCWLRIGKLHVQGVLKFVIFTVKDVNKITKYN